MLAMGREAAGLMSESEAEGWMGHVSTCQPCARQLLQALQAAQSELSDSERMIAERLQPPARTTLGIWTKWPIAAAAAVVLFGAWQYLVPSVTEPEKQLAAAYTGKRRIELRWLGAKHGPMRVELGSGASGADLPESFYGAKQAVLRKIEKGDTTAEWLSVYGQTLILENQPEAAISQLKRALDASSASDPMPIKLALAIAYCQRGDMLHRAIDYQAADQLLGEILQAMPTHREALFNRAVVQGKLENPLEAVAFWNSLIRIEGDEAWKQEAVERKLRQEDKLKTKPKASAESGLQDYLTGNLDPNTRLAELLIVEHDDRWLRDHLIVPAHPIVPALRRMAEGRKRVEFPNWSVVEPVANLVANRLAPRTLRVWAAFEYAYWQTHATEGKPWPSVSINEAVRMAELAGYRWFAVQLLLERSSHHAFLGEQAANISDTEHAVGLASRAGFGNLHLRSLNFLGSAYIRRGDYKHAMETIVHGMAEYWREPADAMRAYHFLFDSMRVAQATGRSHAAYPPVRTAVEICSPADYAPQMAAGSVRAAEWLVKSGEAQQAARHFEAADRAISRMPASDFTQTYRMLLEISRADALRDPHTLDNWLEQMRRHDEPFMRLRYFRTRAELLLEAGSLSTEALRDLTEAVRFATISATSLHTSARLGWQRETAQAWRTLVAAYLDAREPERALAIWQRFLSLPATAISSARLEQTHHPGLIRVKGMSRGTSMFTFFDYRGKMGRWRVDASGVAFQWLPSRSSEIYQRSRKIAVLASERNSPIASLEGELRWMHSQLLAGFQGREILVQPDLEMARIPWTMLSPLTGSSVSVTPWVSETPPSSEHTSGPALLVTANRIAPRFTRQFGTLDAFENSLSVVGSQSVVWRSIEGLDATGERLDRALTSTHLLQFTGHGYPTPDGVGLLLAPSDKYPEGIWLPSADGPPLKHLRLAVFTACSTARYEEAQTSEPQHLAEAFLLRSAGAVVAALWNIDAAASANWTNSFYRKLAAGASPSAATQGVNAEFGTQPKTSHPYWWAAFQVYRLV